ncbi:MAG TPA: hypothetical protein VFH45_11220 [Acidimicrobiales bacterium]|nr:hypothetical protein [Acidimicrobiales bacterium]
MSPSEQDSPLSAPPEVAALIAAAVEVTWPRPVIVADSGPRTDDRFHWRMSGRWWARPLAVRRARPWRW